MPLCRWRRRQLACATSRVISPALTAAMSVNRAKCSDLPHAIRSSSIIGWQPILRTTDPVRSSGRTTSACRSPGAGCRSANAPMLAGSDDIRFHSTTCSHGIPAREVQSDSSLPLPVPSFLAFAVRVAAMYRAPLVVALLRAGAFRIIAAWLGWQALLPLVVSRKAHLEIPALAFRRSIMAKSRS